MCADLAVLSADYFSVPPKDTRGINAVLTVVGGEFVNGEQERSDLSPPLPPASPSWSPVGAEPSPAMRAKTQSAPVFA